MNEIIHFEIGTHDADKVVKFYKDTFGWKFNKWGGPQEYWLIDTGKEKPGISGGVFKSDNGQQVVNFIGVPNIDEYIKKIETNGGKIVVPKKAIPGVGWLAYFHDVEDNLFGVMQEDNSAK
jgi:predicted enzyme related to lactoylglutathione lyase